MEDLCFLRCLFARYVDACLRGESLWGEQCYRRRVLPLVGLMLLQVLVSSRHVACPILMPPLTYTPLWVLMLSIQRQHNLSSTTPSDCTLPPTRWVRLSLGWMRSVLPGMITRPGLEKMESLQGNVRLDQHLSWISGSMVAVCRATLWTLFLSMTVME